MKEISIKDEDYVAKNRMITGALLEAYKLYEGSYDGKSLDPKEEDFDKKEEAIERYPFLGGKKEATEKYPFLGGKTKNTKEDNKDKLTESTNILYDPKIHTILTERYSDKINNIIRSIRDTYTIKEAALLSLTEALAFGNEDVELDGAFGAPENSELKEDTLVLTPAGKKTAIQNLGMMNSLAESASDLFTKNVNFGNLEEAQKNLDTLIAIKTLTDNFDSSVK